MDQEIPVLQTQDPGRAPRALVISGAGARPVSLAAAKRLRFIQNLQMNYQRLKEALEFVEHFAVVCELSQVRIQAIRQAKDAALEELSSRFGEKLKVYDARIGGPSS